MPMILDFDCMLRTQPCPFVHSNVAVGAQGNCQCKILTQGSDTRTGRGREGHSGQLCTQFEEALFADQAVSAAASQKATQRN